MDIYIVIMYILGANKFSVGNNCGRPNSHRFLKLSRSATVKVDFLLCASTGWSCQCFIENHALRTRHDSATDVSAWESTNGACSIHTELDRTKNFISSVTPSIMFMA